MIKYGLGEGSSGQPPRKLDKNVIMNDPQGVFQDVQGKVTDYIKKYDSQNGSGAEKNQLDILDKMLKQGENILQSVEGMIGQDNMNQIAQQNNSNPQSSQSICPQGYRWDGIKMKCVIDCPAGYIWDEGTQQCVIDPMAQFQSLLTDDDNTGLLSA